MDGLLLDTETLALESFRSTCHDFHYEVPDTTYHRCLGTNSAGTEAILKEALGQDFPTSDFFENWSDHFRSLTEHNPIPVKPGAMDLLAKLQQHHIPRAVATSSSERSAQHHLTDAGLRPFFQTLACGNEVQHGKPAPDIYLLAAQRLGVDPTHCLALEDSNNGVLAALAAGMKVIQIPDILQPDAEFLKHGHLLLHSLHEVSTWLFAPSQ